MTSKYSEEVAKLLASLNGENDHQEEPQTTIPDPNSTEEIQDIYVLILRENPDLADVEPTVIDSIVTDLDTTPLPTQPASNAAIGVWFFGLFVILSCLLFQFYVLFNPLTVTVTLAAKSQQVSLQGTLQLGRVLNPITLSQSQTTQTTGHGHQDAHNATGYITFYNGQFLQVTIQAGTILTGSDGIQIVTDETAIIPPAVATTPPTYGYTSVSAHTLVSGAKGNIPPRDINQSCCAPSILAQNTDPFHGGQDERDFQTVAKSDITTTADTLKATLAQSVQSALQGQLKQGEQLQSLPCSPTVTLDHQIGQEATTVKVTVSQTCSGIAYNDQELTSKVTQLLTSQATTKLGAGYSLLENPQITITSATTAKQVLLSYSSVSTWVYALSSAEQKHIKKIIAGKNPQQATMLLLSLPGIESASLHWSGFGDDTRIPKNISYIHLLIFYAAA